MWIDDCRSRKRKQEAFSPEWASFCTDPDYAEVRGSIEWLAERLPSRNLEVWLLHTYFNYSMREIAEDFGLSVPAIKSVLFRTRSLLRLYRKKSDSGIIPFVQEGPVEAAISSKAEQIERWSKAVLSGEPCL